MTPNNPAQPSAAYTLHAGLKNPLQRAAELLAESAGPLFTRQKRLRLAIPGGSAMQAALLLKAILAETWSQVALTWVDERCVRSADADSNRGAALRAGIERDTAAGALLPLYQDDESPAAAVQRVSALLKLDFASGLDLVLLGMGEDGHIASIFPGAVSHGEAWVAHIPESPKPPPSRITLTHPFLQSAQRTVLVATGENKRAPLEHLLRQDPKLPAVGLPDLQIMTDLSITAPPLRSDTPD